MSVLRQLKIAAPNGTARHVQVELDGESITNGLTGIDLHLHVDELVTATLAMRVGVEFDGQVRSVLSEETQTLLKRLGWTPPSDAGGE